MLGLNLKHVNISGPREACLILGQSCNLFCVSEATLVNEGTHIHEEFVNEIMLTDVVKIAYYLTKTHIKISISWTHALWRTYRDSLCWHTPTFINLLATGKFISKFWYKVVVVTNILSTLYSLAIGIPVSTFQLFYSNRQLSSRYSNQYYIFTDKLVGTRAWQWVHSNGISPCLSIKPRPPHVAHA